MNQWPDSVIGFVAALDSFFAEEVPCSCEYAAMTGVGCDFHWFLARLGELPLELQEQAATFQGDAGVKA